MIPVLLVLAGTAFLAVLALALFVSLVISMHRTPRVPLSDTPGKRAGSFARCVIAGVGTESKEESE